MRICHDPSRFSAVLIALVPYFAGAQTAAPPAEPPKSIAIPDKVEMSFSQPGQAFEHGHSEMLNALLREVKPVEIAASVFDIPADKIEVVPQIYWREAKWTDWAEKANQAKGATAWTGPDGKFVMSARVGPYDDLHLEFGPAPRKNPAEYSKFEQAESKVLERIGAKMVRQMPDFSVNYEHNKLMREYDQLHQRLRDLNAEIEKLRHEIGSEIGLLPPAQLTERLADLAKQQLANQMSLDVMKARAGTIREEIDKIKASAEAKVAENQSVRTLKRIVDLRKSRFENLKQQKSQGIVPQSDVDKAEEEMLSAMVEVDRATAAQRKDASQVQLDQLATELTKVSIDSAEAEARYHSLNNAVSETVDTLAKRRDTDAKDDELRSRLTALERRRSELQEQRNQAEDALNTAIEPLQLTLPEQ
jgi:hypothetical protein